MTSLDEVRADLSLHGDILPSGEAVAPRATEKAGKEHWRPQPRAAFGPPGAGEQARIRENPVLSPRQAMALISVVVGQPFRTRALARWRRAETGPPVAYSGDATYSLAELDTWLDSLT